MNRKIARVLFMTFEHEGLHTETLLYMLLQRAGSGTLPPPGFTPPPWSSLATTWDSAPLPKMETVTLGPETVTIGHDDSEADDLASEVAGHEFGWDNEHPKREVHVDKFRIDWRPVTNAQFHEFYVGAGKGKASFPSSWVEVNGEIQVCFVLVFFISLGVRLTNCVHTKVRTLYGPVPMRIAQNWPVMTSYNNLSTYAIVKGGRIPTEPELRLFYDKFHSGYEGGANLGFRNWHPVPWVHSFTCCCSVFGGLIIIAGRRRAGSVAVGKGATAVCGSGRRLHSINTKGLSRRLCIPGMPSLVL